MRTSETLSEIAGALVLAQNDLQNPAKTAKVAAGQKRWNFAPLPDILDDARPILNSNGISILQDTVTTDGGVGVTTRLQHVSGEWVEFGPLLFPRPNDAQAIGSALTYARRYAVTAALGIAPDEDDDGQRASGGSTRSANTAHSGQAQSGQAADGLSGSQPAKAAPSENAAGVDAHPPAAPAGTGVSNETIAYGEGAIVSFETPVPAPTYLNRDDQALLKAEYGGQVEAIKAYQAKFGDRVKRLADITYSMRDEMQEAAS